MEIDGMERVEKFQKIINLFLKENIQTEKKMEKEKNFILMVK